ncbi:MAG: DOMON-like domain-containing protein [Sphingomonadaceae bacterium]|nr:DOMON-like domain-containing protein [Sphingomonadaceae bacterium]
MFALVPHSAHPPVTARGVTVGIERVEDILLLTYRIEGEIVVPSAVQPSRADNLWRTTCCELFLFGPAGSYRELNFSPSGAWAAYAFDHYREGMRETQVGVGIDVEQARDVLILRVRLALDLAETDRLVPAAVVEEAGGHISYWALVHPCGAPDFHDRGCASIALADIAAP